MICRDASVGAAGQTTPTEPIELPLQIIYYVVKLALRERVVWMFFGILGFIWCPILSGTEERGLCPSSVARLHVDHRNSGDAPMPSTGGCGIVTVHMAPIYAARINLKWRALSLVGDSSC